MINTLQKSLNPSEHTTKCTQLPHPRVCRLWRLRACHKDATASHQQSSGPCRTSTNAIPSDTEVMPASSNRHYCKDTFPQRQPVTESPHGPASYIWTTRVTGPAQPSQVSLAGCGFAVPTHIFWLCNSLTKAEQGMVAGRPKAIGYISYLNPIEALPMTLAFTERSTHTTYTYHIRTACRRAACHQCSHRQSLVGHAYQISYGA